MRMKLVRAVAAGVLAIGLSAGSTFAAPINTATQSKSYTFADIGSGAQSLTFDGFDSSLGTLTSVHLTLTVDHITLTDQASVFPQGTGDKSVGSPDPLTATGTIAVSDVASLLSASASLMTPGFTGTVADDGTVHDIGSATNSSPLVDMATLLSPPTDLTSYIGGTNSVTLSINYTGTQGGSVPSGVLTGNTGSANDTVELYYDYSTTSVPEPATLSILGLGLVGLGAARRRQRRKQG